MTRRNAVRLRAKADAARDAQRWHDASKLYQSYLAAVADDAPIWVQLGHARKESGDGEAAMQAYRRALALAPGAADTHLQIGHMEKQRGNTAAAAARYAEAARLDPSLDHAAQELADLAGAGPELPPAPLLDQADHARAMRRWPEAARLYEAYLETEGQVPVSQPIWVQLGHARKEAGDWDGAAAAYEQALLLQPGDAATHLHLAHLLKNMGAYDPAYAAFSAALQHDPSLSEAEHERQALAGQRPGGAASAVMLDRYGALNVAYPLPRAAEDVAFQQHAVSVFTGLSRRFDEDNQAVSA